MNDPTLNAYKFQFPHNGKLSFAAITHDALVKVAGRNGNAEYLYSENKALIQLKAKKIADSNEVRSPFLLVTTDFD